MGKSFFSVVLPLTKAMGGCFLVRCPSSSFSCMGGTIDASLGSSLGSSLESAVGSVGSVGAVFD